MHYCGRRIQMRHAMSLRFLALVSVLAFYGCGNTATTPDSANSSTAGSPASSDAKPAAPSAPSAPPIVIDAGTPVVVTADQSISSKTSNPGDHFDASLAEPVTVGEKQVIPSGAKVTGRVTVAK